MLPVQYMERIVKAGGHRSVYDYCTIGLYFLFIPLWVANRVQYLATLPSHS